MCTRVLVIHESVQMYVCMHTSLYSCIHAYRHAACVHEDKSCSTQYDARSQRKLSNNMKFDGFQDITQHDIIHVSHFDA